MRNICELVSVSGRLKIIYTDPPEPESQDEPEPQPVVQEEFFQSEYRDNAPVQVEPETEPETQIATQQQSERQSEPEPEKPREVSQVTLSKKLLSELLSEGKNELKLTFSDGEADISIVFIPPKPESSEEPSAETVAADEEMSVQTVDEPTQNSSAPALYIIIAAALALAVVGAVTFILIIRKKSNTSQSAKSNA